MKKNTGKYLIGVDFGGTKILSALVKKNGRIIERIKVPTEARLGKSRVIGNIKSLIRELLIRSDLTLSDIEAIGIAAPGPVLFKKGIILYPPNLPGWRKVPLSDIISSEFGKKVFMENDADTAALGEMFFGAGKGCKNFVYITVSTGIGGGIVLGGKLMRGVRGGAGEVGHMIIKTDGPKCGCGNRGCLEAMASGTAIARLAKEKLGKDWDSLDVEKAARAGNSSAMTIINEVAFNLGVGVANLINILAPDMIILGGGVMNMADLILPRIISTAKNNSLSPAGDGVKIVKAKLGSDAGVLGAASLCLVEL